MNNQETRKRKRNPRLQVTTNASSYDDSSSSEIEEGPPGRDSDLYALNRFFDVDNQIRLLKLHAGTETAELEATFILSDGKSIPYDALSYYWGEEDRSAHIRMLSHGNAYSLTISSNLESALRHLRHMNSSRVLWVDHLCINQIDNEEKNGQIPKMKQIYASAKCVRVWLGEEADQSTLALKFVNQVLNLESFDSLVQDPRRADEWRALAALMRRPWFSRRWVIQEITFANRATIHCGKDFVKWKDFAHVVALVGVRHNDIKTLYVENSAVTRSLGIGNLADVTSLGASRLVHASRNLFHRSEDGEIIKPILSLEALVHALSPFKTSRPVDTIYAILPLAEDIMYIRDRRHILEPLPSPDTIPPEPVQLENDTVLTTARFFIQKLRTQLRENTYPVDYNKSFYEVCKDFIEFSIRRSRSLDIICRPWAVDNEELPSWVSQLSDAPFQPGSTRADTRVRGDSLVAPPGERRIYNADETKIARFSIGRNLSPEGNWVQQHEKSLFVNGFVLDTVGKKAWIAQQGNIPGSWPKFGHWVDTSSFPPDAFWRTLVADRGPDGLQPPSYYQLACHHAFDQRIVGGDLVIKELMQLGMPRIVIEFLERVQAIVFQRRLIRSKNLDRLGLAPAKTKKGDLICALQGLSVPILLRPMESDEKKRPCYKIVGECYLHGMMNGESSRLQKLKHSTDISIEFEIR